MATKQPNRQLKSAREARGYSQQEVADLLRVGKNTYQRWESGETFPQPPFRRLLSEKLHASLQELGLIPGNSDPPSATIELKDASYDSEGMNQYLQGHLGQRLLGIVDAGTYDDQCNHFAQIMEQFDAMNTENQHYEITRRQAVISLAIFPFAPPIDLVQRERVASSHYELFVNECGASLAACEELARSSDTRDLWLAFRCVSRYLVELEVICNSFSRYRTQAQELAAHCAILKTLLGWVCKDNSSVLIFAQDAMRISCDSGNICLQLSARVKMAWAYFDGGERELALETASGARDLLKQYKEQRLPIGIRGGTYSTLSVMQARNGLNPDWAIKKASEQGPDNEIQFLMEFTSVNMLHEQGDALYYVGETGKAMHAYTQVIDSKTLEATKPFQGMLIESWRLQVVEGMARASLEGEARNMGNAIRYWEAAIEGAKKRKSEGAYRRALALHDDIKKAFPGERQVYNLRDHFRRSKDWK